MAPVSSQGGSRQGAGRPVGSGPFGEPTERLRVPRSQVPAVVAYLDTYRQISSAAQTEEPGTAVALDPQRVAFDPPKNRLKRVGTGVSAGFPSPADDYMQDALDFNEHLVNARHKDATFVMRVSGWSMIGAGILDGDKLVVDRAIKPAEGHIVVAVVNGEFTIKRLRFRDGKPVLMAENPHFKERRFEDNDVLEIWGVVTGVVRTL